MHVRARLRRARRRRRGAGDHLRPHPAPARRGQARRPVLVLLLLQPVQRSSRIATGRACRSSSTRTAPALRSCSGPSEIGLFQHGGGEKADWDDEKVEKQGNHPIVYPAAGSHATFYGSAIYIENGQRGSGLGCDNASEPLRRLALRPVLVPTHPTPWKPLPMAHLRGALGPAGGGVQQRAYRAEHEAAVAEAPGDQWTACARSSPALPGGRDLRPDDHRCRSAARSPQSRPSSTSRPARRSGRDRARDRGSRW